MSIHKGKKNHAQKRIKNFINQIKHQKIEYMTI